MLASVERSLMAVVAVLLLGCVPDAVVNVTAGSGGDVDAAGGGGAGAGASGIGASGAGASGAGASGAGASGAGGSSTCDAPSHVRSDSFDGGGGQDHLRALAANASGFAVVGSATGAIDLGDGVLGDSGDSGPVYGLYSHAHEADLTDMFVAVGHRQNSADTGKATAVAFSASSEIDIAGLFGDAQFATSLETGSGGVLSTTSNYRVFFSRVSSTAVDAFAMGNSLTDGAITAITPIASTGGAILAGWYQGNFGSGTTQQSPNDHNILLVEVGDCGTSCDEIEATSFGDAGDQEALDMALYDDATVLLTGRYRGDLYFGAEKMTSPTDEYANGFVAMVDVANWPAALKSIPLTGVGELAGRAIASRDGAIVVAGDFTSDVSVGTKQETGDNDIFVVGLNPVSFQPDWLRSFGAPSAESHVHDIVISDSGDIVVAGAVEGALDFGVLKLVTTEDAELFVVKLDPQGNPICAAQFGDGVLNVQLGTRDGTGDFGSEILLGGTFLDGQLDFGGAPLVATSADMFLARLKWWML